MAPFKGPQLAMIFNSGTTEKQGDCQVHLAGQEGHLTLSRTTVWQTLIVHLLKTPFFLLFQKLEEPGLLLPPPWYISKILRKL